MESPQWIERFGKVMSVLIIKTDGTYETLPPGSGEPKLEWLKEQVGGWIEIVRLNLEDGIETQMIANEEGLIHGLPKNGIATALYRATARNNGRGTINDIIVGDVVILNGPNLCT